MTDIFILIAFILGWGLCYYTMRPTAIRTDRIVRRAPKTEPVVDTTEAANPSPDIPPVKAHTDLMPPSLSILRQTAFAREEAQARKTQRDLQMVKDLV